MAKNVVVSVFTLFDKGPRVANQEDEDWDREGYGRRYRPVAMNATGKVRVSSGEWSNRDAAVAYALQQFPGAALIDHKGFEMTRDARSGQTAWEVGPLYYGLLRRADEVSTYYPEEV